MDKTLTNAFLELLSKQAEEVSVEMSSVTTDDGNITLTYEGELAAGVEVFVTDEEGNSLPAPAGVYSVDGQDITVEGGMVVDTKETEELEAEAEEVTEEEMSEVEETEVEDTEESFEAEDEDEEVEAEEETEEEEMEEEVEDEDMEEEEEKDLKSEMAEMLATLTTVLDEKLSEMSAKVDEKLAALETEMEEVKTTPLPAKTAVPTAKTTERFSYEGSAKFKAYKANANANK